MDKKIQKLAKKVMSASMAARNSDPYFYQSMSVLPNPDPILRKHGYAHDTYDSILADAHVAGEVRSIRGELIWDFKISQSQNSRANKAALNLIQEWFKSPPSQLMTWDDIFWQMGEAIFYGHRIHELNWMSDGNYVLPMEVCDRPNRRFIFNNDNQLRLLTKEQPTNGIDVPAYKFIISRHQPTSENPYGRAILSSCFWPYTFKTGGFKFFYKFCERHGMPFPFGRYPKGSPESEQYALLDALINGIEDGAFVAPDGSSIELIEAKSSGGGNKLAQQLMIELCNKEMSKALTSQVLASDQTDTGARAASETHKSRQEAVNRADRKIIERSINDIIQWITLLNFGGKADAPIFEFCQEKVADKERAEVFQIAQNLGAKISADAFMDEFGIKKAENDEDMLTATCRDLAALASGDGSQFSQQSSSCENCGSSHLTYSDQLEDDLKNTAIESADESISNHWLEPIYQSLLSYEKAGKTLLQWQTDLPKLFNQLDDDTITTITSQVLQLSAAEGAE